MRRLVREVVAEALYHPTQGYFAATAEIHALPAPLDFARLRGRRDYDRAVAALYAAAPGEAWHTPAETLKPYYAQAFARRMVQHAAAAGPALLDIVEVGGGNGTLMTGVLDYIADAHHALYEQMHYHVVEISAAMHARQQHALARSRHAARAGRHVHLHHASILTWSGPPAAPTASPRPCYVVATEVLDNLPHDKVVRDADGRIWECHVITDRQSGAMREEARPLADPLLRRCLDILGPTLFDVPPSATLTERAQAWTRRLLLDPAERATTEAFVPTAALQLLERVAAVVPTLAGVVLADFDALPHGLAARLGPTVQRRLHGTTVTSDTYLVPRGSCDIMFPTDFGLLRALHAHVLQRDSTVWKQTDFMRLYAPYERARTQDGFNPLLEDYTNVSVLASV